MASSSTQPDERPPLAAFLRDLFSEDSVLDKPKWMERLDCSRPSISLWINGKSVPRHDKLAKIRDVLEEALGRLPPREREDSPPAKLLARWVELGEKSLKELTPTPPKGVSETRLHEYVQAGDRKAFHRQLADVEPEARERVLGASLEELADFGRLGFSSSERIIWRRLLTAQTHHDADVCLNYLQKARWSDAGDLSALMALGTRLSMALGRRMFNPVAEAVVDRFLTDDFFGKVHEFQQVLAERKLAAGE